MARGLRFGQKKTKHRAGAIKPDLDELKNLKLPKTKFKAK